MSGAIRRLIEPAIGRLRTKMIPLRTLLDNDEEMNDRIAETLRTGLVQLKQLLAYLDQQHTEWQTLLRQFATQNAQLYAAEDQLHANFAFDERHFLEWMDDARQIITDIEIALTNASVWVDDKFSGIPL